MSIDKHVGARLKAQRMAEGLSQEQLGVELGVSYQQVQKYENGKNQLNPTALFNLARVLKVTVEFFFDGLDARQSRPGFAEDEQSPFEFSAMSPDVMKLVLLYQRMDARDRNAIMTLADTLVAKTAAGS